MIRVCDVDEHDCTGHILIDVCDCDCHIRRGRICWSCSAEFISGVVECEPARGTSFDRGNVDCCHCVAIQTKSVPERWRDDGISNTCIRRNKSVCECKLMVGHHNIEIKNSLRKALHVRRNQLDAKSLRRRYQGCRIGRHTSEGQSVATELDP